LRTGCEDDFVTRPWRAAHGVHLGRPLDFQQNKRNTINMTVSMKKRNTKKRGRPATGQDPVSAIRLPIDLTAAIDKWGEKNDAPSRSEAIRRLVELGLAGAKTTPRRSSRAAAKAADMAAEQIDKLADPSATDEERRTRKRRLLRGPQEFRDIRSDLSKRKG